MMVVMIIFFISGFASVYFIRLLGENINTVSPVISILIFIVPPFIFMHCRKDLFVKNCTRYLDSILPFH